MSALAGTRTLAGLALRRERAVAPWWIALNMSMALLLIGYIQRVMPTDAVKAAYTAVISRNTFFQALGGGFVEPRLDVLATWRSGGFLYVASAFAAVMCVVRHTRAEEDAGRAELLRAAGTGRRAPLTAALLVAAGTSLLGGLLTALALVAAGLEPVGSAAYGAAITAVGWVFAGVAAVAVQLSRTARTATTIGLFTLGVAYVMRYIGDATRQYWLKALSPIGWGHLVRPYQDERWWLLGLSAGVAAALCALAYALLDRRDLGAGMVPERLGPASAPGPRGPVGTAWRLHRGLLARWAAGVAVLAIATAGAGTLAGQLAAMPGIAQGLLRNMGGPTGGALDVYQRYMTLIFAHVIALYPVLMVRRLRSEETSGRAETLLATPLTRLRWAGGHLALAGLGSAALLAVAGVVHGVLYGLLVGDLAADPPRVLAGMLSHVPAVWSVGAAGVLAYGLLPRASVAVSWAVWILTAVLGQLAGPLYGMWAGTPLEPFHYVPDVFGDGSFDAGPYLLLFALTAALVGGGLLALRRRDLG
ncbi:ABC transporter permease [Nonomuraea roseoviolacea]|uniref:ABC-2 type transport system permease protein n=1 Tax=Nonomuraea roseoviolacea subsp. carminata TaxID=160689 RepID=A0ABT1K0J8_9ACTN|nr:polyketide antibiotic transporter [Nonomuraea roseoviolacea]MCP2347521.1 ABC-2 type transport system permease protein [Nonomuraea roseoviolacea subsp. carminata]